MFLFTNRIFENPSAYNLASIYQFMSAIGYVIEDIDQTPSDELFYVRWKSLSKQVFNYLVSIDQGQTNQFDKECSFKLMIREMMSEYETSNELIEFLIERLKPLFNDSG